MTILRHLNFLVLICLFAAWCGPVHGSQPPGNQQVAVDLTPEERQWLAKHPVIRVHNEKNWPPFNFFEFNAPDGLSVDYIELLAGALQLRLEFITGTDWDEFLRLAATGGLDVMLNIVKTPEREKFLRFTEPYARNPSVIVTPKDETYTTIPQLFGQIVAYPKGFFYNEVLVKSYPQIIRLPVADTLDALKAVQFGRADAALGKAAVIRSVMVRNMLSGIRISGETGLGNPDHANLRLGVRKDWPLLHSALTKAMAAVPQSRLNALKQEWLEQPGARPKTEEKPLPPPEPREAPPRQTAGQAPATATGTAMALSAAVLLAVILVSLLLVRLLKKEQVAVSFGSPWFRWLVIAGLTLFIILVLVAGKFLMDRNRALTRHGIEQQLTGILTVSGKRLDLWLEERKAFMGQLGRDPQLVEITRRLLDVRASRQVLINSPPLADARWFFRKNEDIFTNIGFFIINPDYTSIGSMRDTNLGTRNLIAERNPELLKTAFQGKVVFVPPMTSDVVLDKATGQNQKRKPPTMFFMGPVQDARGKVIAVMTLRVDPLKDLARTMKIFERYQTFEVYAFDRLGRLLTPSRFEEELRDLGLLAPGLSSALNLDIRDPGADLAKGEKPALPETDRPLTFMASRAIALERQMAASGITRGSSAIEWDTRGYRDYRGVPVFGAWLWNRDMDLGLAAEIDMDEALAIFNKTQATIYTILGVTLFLTVGAVLFVLIVGERTSRALMRSRDNLEEKVAARTAELKDNQERFAALLESAPDAMVVSDEAGNMVLVNSQTEKLFGYTRSDLLGHPVELLVPDYIKKTHPQNRARFLAKARVRRMGAGVELTAQTRDGGLIPVDIGLSPLKTRDGILVVASVRDITERKAAEEALSAERARLQRILDTSPVGVAISTKGIVRFTNPTFREMFGVTVGEASPDLYVNPEERERLLAKLKSRGSVRGYELQCYGRNREIRDMLVTYLPIPFEGEEGILGWLQDITVIKQAQQKIQEKYDELSRFRKLAVGREKKMIELKKEINMLAEQMGQAPRYKIVG